MTIIGNDSILEWIDLDRLIFHQILLKDQFITVKVRKGLIRCSRCETGFLIFASMVFRWCQKTCLCQRDKDSQSRLVAREAKADDDDGGAQERREGKSNRVLELSLQQHKD